MTVLLWPSSSILGLLTLFLLSTKYSHGVVYTSSGNSGAVCGSEGVRCLTPNNAQCDTATGTCSCVRQQFPDGNGRLACYRPNEIHASVVNDPTISTFNQIVVDAPFTCRYLFTHVTTALYGRGRNNQIGTCITKVHVFHYKDKGKAYVAGVDLAIVIKYKRQRNYKASIRITGSAQNGDYTYTVLATEGKFKPDGPFGEDEIKYRDNVNKVSARVKFDRQNNILRFEANKCGFRLRYRAYDLTLRRNQTQLPGVTVVFNRNNIPWTFRSSSKVLSMVPKDIPRGFTIDDILLPGLGRKETLIHRALRRPAPQTQPEGNGECTASKGYLSKCSKREKVTAYNNCYWILKVPRFIRRYDGTTSGVKIMGLFNRCMAIYCDGANCAGVIDLINNSWGANVTGYPELDGFKSGANCP